MLKLKDIKVIGNKEELISLLQNEKTVVNTINAHSYNTAQKDDEFTKALLESDILIPDGFSVVLAMKWLRNLRIERIAGWDLFVATMNKKNKEGGSCFFLGSSDKTLAAIKEKAKKDYPNIKVECYSPPYKAEFTEEENKEMINLINKFNPDILWIGMTAPKQEKWVHQHKNELSVNGVIGCIGGAFDFYAGTIKRAPESWQKNGFEWAYRLLKEPKRMWKRYIIGNSVFLWHIFKEKVT